MTSIQAYHGFASSDGGALDNPSWRSISQLLRDKDELTKAKIRPPVQGRTSIEKDIFFFLHTFGGILFNNLDLIIPGMQSAICVTVSQVNCFFFEVWRQEKGCFHAQRIKYMLLAVYDQSVNIRSWKSTSLPELLQGLSWYLFHKESDSISTPAVSDYSQGNDECEIALKPEESDLQSVPGSNCSGKAGSLP